MSETTDRPDWTIDEIAVRHQLSRQVVTRLFKNEKGIHEITGGGKLRRHVTRRIPNAVYLRVFGRITKAMKKKLC